MTIGIGLIGAGKHGVRYLRHIADVPALRIAALCRRDREAGERQARDAGCRFYADPLALIEAADVDAVAIVAPPTVNVTFATAAARAGKALLIEKPLAVSLAGCRAIGEAVEASGVTAMVAHTLRFNAVVRVLRAALPSIGTLNAAVFTQRFEPTRLGWLDRLDESGGGIVLHTGVHSFDLLRFFTGREAVRVTASTGRVTTRETEDRFEAIVEMEDGLTATIAGSRTTASRRGSIDLVGLDGQLVGDHVHGIAAKLVGVERVPLEVGPPAQTVEDTLREFAAAIIERRAPAITLADGAASVAIAEACYRSVKARAAVDVERW